MGLGLGCVVYGGSLLVAIVLIVAAMVRGDVGTATLIGGRILHEIALGILLATVVSGIGFLLRKWWVASQQSKRRT